MSTLFLSAALFGTILNLVVGFSNRLESNILFEVFIVSRSESVKKRPNQSTQSKYSDTRHGTIEQF